MKGVLEWHAWGFRMNKSKFDWRNELINQTRRKQISDNKKGFDKTAFIKVSWENDPSR